MRDPNREQLMAVASAFGDLRSDVLFVGGVTLGLLITDAAAPSVRPTVDVDVVIEVSSYVDYQTTIADALRVRGFEECRDPGAPICAWMVSGIRVDVMPSAEDALGFSNPWYEEAMANAVEMDIDGMTIQVISIEYFLATKFVAFENRGEGDYYESHDLEDIVAVINGRSDVVASVAAAQEDVRTYLGTSCEQLLKSRDFINALPGHVETGRKDVVLVRLQELANHPG